ncbi:MAG: DEAD/DEAH box helicase [Chloroflexi bacterium]|nr:DEAD/DEAH box helicase [Chloroflexota bacterium]
MQFSELKLIEPLLRAVQTEGYTEPTPIQVQAIPHVLAGKDLIGCAQTGTGKTAAFALPLLQQLHLNSNDKQGRKKVRVLVLSPTRELASQIAESFNVYGRHTGLKTIVIYGGVGQSPQVSALRSGADILVATPGRLLDLMGQGYVRLHTVDMFVLDEADRMLDMGFFPDVTKIIAALPKERQTLMFSATMPAPIQALADDILIDPVMVAVTPPATTVEKIEQAVYFVDKKNKRALLEHLLDDASIRRALVFTRTKHGANKLAEQLERSNIMAEAIHGNKSQTAREKALSNFKRGMTRVLVATDIAARGIDVDDVTHVINFDLPYEPESYVHRIGRTARAGASGIAFSFCDGEEFKLLRDIERLIHVSVPVAEDHPYALSPAAYAAATKDGAHLRPQSRGSRPQGRTDGASRGQNRGYQGDQRRSSQGGRPGSSQGTSSGRSANGGRSAEGGYAGSSGHSSSSYAGNRQSADGEFGYGDGNDRRRRRRRNGKPTSADASQS